MRTFKKTVTVHSGGAAAQEKPRFIIKVNDVYYYTLAVWEYDKTMAGKNAAAAKRCDQISQSYADLKAKGHEVTAVVVDAEKGAGGQIKTTDVAPPDPGPIGDGHGN